MADAGVDEALAFLGIFVLGVFGEVAVGAGDCNFLGQVDVSSSRSSAAISSCSFCLILASGSDMVIDGAVRASSAVFVLCNPSLCCKRTL